MKAADKRAARKKSDLDDLADLREEMELMAQLEKQLAPKKAASNERTSRQLPKHRLRAKDEESKRAEVFQSLTGSHTLNEIEFSRWDGPFGDDVRGWLGDYVNDLLAGIEDPLERMLTLQFVFCHHRAAGLLESSVRSNNLEVQSARNNEAGKLMNIARRQAETIQKFRESRAPKQPDLTSVVQVIVNVLQVIGKENLTNELGSIDVTKLSAQLSRAALPSGSNQQTGAVEEIDRAKNGTRKGAEPVERTPARAPKPGSRGSKARRKGNAKGGKRGAQ